MVLFSYVKDVKRGYSMSDQLLQRVKRSVESKVAQFANFAGITFGHLYLMEPELIDDTHVGIYKLAWKMQILDTKYLDPDLEAIAQDNWIHNQIWFVKGQPEQVEEIEITLFNLIVYTYYQKLDRIMRDLNRTPPQELP